MITKLPPWAFPAACVLAFAAGIVNVIGLIGFSHQTVSHLTGNTSMLAVSVARFDHPAMLHFGCVIGAFMAGATLSAFVTRDVALELGWRYSVALLVESLALFLTVPLWAHRSDFGLYLAAMACGIQNAIVSTFSGTVVRTTHVSGMFTDLGISMGHILAGGIGVNRRRIHLSLVVIAGFFCGGLCGSWSYNTFESKAFVIPAGIVLILAVLSYFFRAKKQVETLSSKAGKATLAQSMADG